MNKTIIIISDWSAKKQGKSLSWLLVWYVSRGWTLLSTHITSKEEIGKVYTLGHSSIDWTKLDSMGVLCKK